MTASWFPRVAVCVFCIALLCTLSGSVAAQEHSSASNSIVTVTDADNGKDIEINAGQTLRVELASNPSTGYDWTLSGDPAPLKLIKSFHQNNKQGANRPGAPRTAVFQLRSPSPGAANVTFVYRRSWEYNVAPAKTFSVRVNVR